ncbi:hypothetical protein B0H12DRAFT_1090886 [Mycena haematopus]|nr:hypothetical protein B0H12DRAFT_1090886 [Mycena haematopus]
MPPSAIRNCGMLRVLRVWMVQLASPLTRHFKHVVPELPFSTLDLRRDRTVEIPSVPEDATEDEKLVLSSPQPELEVARSQGLSETILDRRSSAHFADGNIQQIIDSSEAAILSPSPVPTPPSASLSMSTPPLIQMSLYHLPEIYPSLHDLTDDAKEGDVTPGSRIGELGKRRGFKGAPLFTPETAKKSSLLSLSSAVTSKIPLSPRLSPSTPRTARPSTPRTARPSTPRTARPSTPRTPLATVTNLLRTPTLKSPKPSAMPMECPVSDELQQYYDLHDPFSAMGQSFYDPDIVCTSVPFSNLDSLKVYRPAPNAVPVRIHKTFFNAVEAVSQTKPRIPDTNVFDTIVYSYEPKVIETLNQGTGKSAGRSQLSRSARVSNSTTIVLLSEYPSLRFGPGGCGDSQPYDISPTMLDAAT